MAISSIGKPPSSSPPRIEPKGSRLDDQERASRATREAQERVEESEKRIREAENEAGVRIDHLRGDSDRQVEAEAIRQEASIEGERNKGYASLRELKLAQQAELNRVRREGERELAQAQSYYRDTVYNTEKKGKEDLTQLETQQANRQSFTEKTHHSEMEDAKNAHAFENERLKADEENKFHQLEQASRAEYDRYRTNTEDAKKKADTEFKAKYVAVKSDHDTVISDLDGRASGDINKTRMDTAAKLAAYGARQEDPFYKLIDVDARLKDDGDAFVLRATIPEHEREHISIAVRGNQVVLSGSRRNEEKLALEPGREKATNSYQAYHESFQLGWPVDVKGMKKEFDGDELVVTIPKKSVTAEPIKNETPKPEKARLERPKFPGNLPLSKYQEEQAQGDLHPPAEGSDGRRPRRGSRTLA